MAIDTPHLTRHVHLDALFNVRDLGGYYGRAGQTVRWNRVYRADDLPRATSGDLQVLAELGIRTVIDLRTERERAARPTPRFASAQVNYHHLPLVRRTWDEAGHVPVQISEPRGAVDHDRAVDFLAARYLEMLVEGAPAIAEALRVIASPAAQPVVFHCSLGKDRTGLLAAVLLALLGVHDEAIGEDYGQSTAAVISLDAWLAHHHPERGAALADLPSHWISAPPEAILKVLEHVRGRCNSMTGFVRSIGVSFETIEALHRQLLD